MVYPLDVSILNASSKRHVGVVAGRKRRSVRVVN